uniref:Photolyase/cryptochrome alpha/beta domain-containing protein n=1 Tax=Romanomermis culicivorax TaxID=13658 RepID=A0A915JTH5_ROMCU
MLEAIKELHGYLSHLGITLLTVNETPDQAVTLLSKDAIEIIVDMNYLKVHRLWYKNAAETVRCSLTQIETNAVVPVEIASSKEESDVDEFREKIRKVENRFLQWPVQSTSIQSPIFKSAENLSDSWFANKMPEVKFVDIRRKVEEILLELDIDRSVKKVQAFSGGYLKARDKLEAFIAHGLQHYDSVHRDNPSRAHTSSRLKFSVKAIHQGHEKDQRQYNYTIEQMERAETGDPLWNAAQREMVVTGRMNSLLRVYWGKRVMEWTPSANEAFETLVKLNDKYQLDGYDPCSYCGIALCFGKFAQKSYAERPIFGYIQALDAREIVGIYGKAVIDRYVQTYCPPKSLKIQRCSEK